MFEATAALTDPPVGIGHIARGHVRVAGGGGGQRGLVTGAVGGDPAGSARPRGCSTRLARARTSRTPARACSPPRPRSSWGIHARWTRASSGRCTAGPRAGVSPTSWTPRALPLISPAALGRQRPLDAERALSPGLMNAVTDDQGGVPAADGVHGPWSEGDAAPGARWRWWAS